MHKLRYLSIDPTWALIVLGAGVFGVALLHLVEIVAQRCARERTRAAIEEIERERITRT